MEVGMGDAADGKLFSLSRMFSNTAELKKKKKCVDFTSASLDGFGVKLCFPCCHPQYRELLLGEKIPKISECLIMFCNQMRGAV